MVRHAMTPKRSAHLVGVQSRNLIRTAPRNRVKQSGAADADGGRSKRCGGNNVLGHWLRVR
jgi:hypothetical protein